MKTFLFLSLVYSFTSLAQVNQVSIKNFDFQYQNPQGQGTAKEFSFSKSTMGVQDISVQKNQSDFHFALSGVENNEFTLSNAPEFITDAEIMTISDLNLDWSQSLSLSIDHANFASIGNDIDLQSFSLYCNRNQANSELLDQLAEGCMYKMNLSAKQFDSGNGNSLLESLTGTLSGGLTVRNIILNIQNGVLNFNADIKAQMSGTAKGKGTASYDVQKNVLTIKIDQVKFGILNVTGKVFDELEKLNSTNVVVSRPYIYVTLK